MEENRTGQEGSIGKESKVKKKDLIILKV